MSSNHRSEVEIRVENHKIKRRTFFRNIKRMQLICVKCSYVFLEIEQSCAVSTDCPQH